MNKLIKYTLALLIGITSWGAFTTYASASSQYSASRSKSVKLVWRHKMGRHARVATRGARYSRHLGTRYSYNSSTQSVTWYTDAHEKLYRYKKGNSAIYYHVKSADGSLQGWIWRGYLKPTSSKSTTSTNTENTSQHVTLWNAKTSAEYANAIHTESYYKLANAVWKLFPGTKLNLWLSQIADVGDQMAFTAKNQNDIADSQSQWQRQYYKQNGVTNLSGCYYWAIGGGDRSYYFSSHTKLPLEERVALLKKYMNDDGLTAAKRSSFKGWYIGINIADDHTHSDNLTYDVGNPNTDPAFTQANTYEIVLLPGDNFQTINNN